MAHRLFFATLLLAAVCGCGQDSVPTDSTQAALQQLRSGQYDDAIATATEAIRQNPRNAAAYLYRGRAYHFRNAMGDHQLAVSDLGEAIRLAPESSDAYYSRALVYRDIGQTDLASKDETKARDLDGLLKETYRHLPDLTPRSTIAKAREPDGRTKQDESKVVGALPKDVDEQKQLYEELKDKFEPGFGELRTQPLDGSADDAGREHTESLSERYRRLLGQDGATGEAAPRGFGGQVPDQFAQPAAEPSTTPSAAPGTANDMGGSTAARRPRGNLPGPLQPQPMQSPFAPRNVTQPAAQMPPGVRSPFPQRIQGATGYVQPVNPFGAQAARSGR